MVNVFISYSHDDEIHKKWVLDLADLLTNNGVFVIFDQYDLKLGKDMFRFMEDAVEKSDLIIVISTPKYYSKSKSRQGGVGFEYSLITTSLYQSMHLDEGNVIPVLRAGNRKGSIPTFLKPIIGLDMTNDDEFDSQIEELLRKIYDKPAVRRPPLGTKPDFDKIKSNTKPKPVSMKNESNELEYDSSENVLNQIGDNFNKYFNKIFVIDDKENSNDRCAKVKLRFDAWDEDINNYVFEFNQLFNSKKIAVYKRMPQIFKSAGFRGLWTVGSALDTWDLELLNYKTAYAGVKPKDLLAKYLYIDNEAKVYIQNIGSKLNFDDVQNIDDLKQDFFNHEEMYLRGVIGLGIRSEFLHRAYPHMFSIMTRRSHWGIYFLAKHANEFIRYEIDKKKDETRFVNEYEYNYPRFNYYCNEVYKLLSNEAESCGISLNTKLRFGYANIFLREIALLHNDDYSEMHKWK